MLKGDVFCAGCFILIKKMKAVLLRNCKKMAKNQVFFEKYR